MKTVKILLLVAAVWCGLNSVCAQTWILTNPPAIILTTNETAYHGNYDATPSVDKNVQESDDYNHESAKMILKKREDLVGYVHMPKTIGGKLISTYDFRVMDSSLYKAGMTTEEIKKLYALSSNNLARLHAGYFRGQFYRKADTWSIGGWITAFTSDDKQKIVLVPDDGPICFSEDFGLHWQFISTQGRYDFTLSQTSKGSALVAKVTLTNLTDSAASEPMAGKNWYSTLSDADGGEMVVTASVSQPAPVLSIAHSDNGVVISWPAAFTNFVLQQNSDLTTTNWMNVTNSVNTVEGQNQIIIFQPASNSFYRLKTP